ncbi:Uncharacterized conserved protein, DUF305 family [Lentzea fradiae]|uniref:Uncharacterized conserved protein, DUF305 family n=1 Tax=Lentzea fradiae TaxID=200378 RepID=A0A1G7KKB8_9PSEU|nr:Uncharacterized conserved protein, DUF305 family [Lentzea fradiae]
MRALVVAAVLAAAGCGAAAPAPVAPHPVSPAPELSATDLAFLDLVIPQNETALAALALVRPGSALRPLADQVAPAYRAELARVREVLTRAGRPESDQHDGHDMPGMVTAAELAAAEHAPDPDDHLKSLLRNQFEEARTVARSALSAGTNATVVELGGCIDKTRETYLATLNAL